MKYIKIRILEHRDNVAYAALQQAAVELNELTGTTDAAKRHAEEIGELAKQSKLPADLDIAAAEMEKAKALSSSLLTACMKVKLASETHSKKTFAHRMVGTFGYQEIDPAKMEVVRLLDEAGKPFPADAVFSYEVVDAQPPMPLWGIPDNLPA